MRTSIATVCVSGGLVEKLHACAAAGFDGVEIMESDLIAAYESPEEIRALCRRLGLSIDMYQPLRDIEAVEESVFLDNLRRAEAKFALMERLGTDLILLCSNAASATIDDDAVIVDQLSRLADAAARHGIRIAYEALAWGRYVDDYRHAWRLVRAADRPNLGICLDSFHILAPGHDTAEIESIPGEKIFFLQLADAPALDLDVLSWSRHHRLFPGEGDFELTEFLGRVLRAGYSGPLSLEVFNDTFRQTDVTRTAEHALRSLRSLADRSAVELGGGADTGRLTLEQTPTGVDFVEIAGADLGSVEQMLDQLGFAFAGHHRSKRVRLWRAGTARIVVNEEASNPRASLAGFGVLVADPEAAARRAKEIGVPSVFRRRGPGEQELLAVAAPDGTEVYWADAEGSAAWQEEFGGRSAQSGDRTASAEGEPPIVEGTIDHLNISAPWQDFDEATLFNSSVLGLGSSASAELPGPDGLLRSRAMRTDDGAVRLAINLAPSAAQSVPRHLAVRVPDAIAVARSARTRGLEFLPIPDNYYDDLSARFDLGHARIAELRDLGLLYDRDATGSFTHFYTPTIGGVFIEIVQRDTDMDGADTYAGYGASNTPVRLAAQRSFTTLLSLESRSTQASGSRGGDTSARLR